MSWKGKGIATDDDSVSPGKRKRSGGDDDDKSGRKRKTHPSVLKFFEDAACEVDESDDSDGFDDFFNDEFLEAAFDTDANVKSEPEKAPQFPVFPKEEEMSEEELDKLMEERYKPGSTFVRYAEDGNGAAGSAQRYTLFQPPPAKEPTIWKVKCMVGRERHSAFCLMQKYVDLHTLGTKLQIISAFAVEHVKGFIFIEAYKQGDINEACKGICSIYFTRVAPVPSNEVSHLFSVRPKYSGISVGTWARVKSGKYKGDLAEVVTVNKDQRKVTVKLIPRIDMQAMAAKFGGGVACKKTAVPAPRLISSSELEDFRPLIQYRRDRETGNIFEVFDGMLLKDGYLFKKVSLDSLSFWGVMPSEDELLKFEPSKNDGSNDAEWLSGLFGERKKKQAASSEKGGEKGETSSSSGTTFFEKHDLVFFGRTGFGVVIGTEKDDRYKVLKEGSEGPIVVTVELRLLKKASFDKKFTALDQHKKTISIGDTIRVLEGPLEDKQGIVRQIYRGTVFLHDENETENGGYSCAKAQICEKVEFGDDCKQKGGKCKPEASAFEDLSSSPKSPLSPKKPWQGRDSNSFNREEKDGMFSVGQSLRIRVGPLKGYLCRVLAIRRTDITVKLDSQQKILSVKAENLAEVRGKSSSTSIGEDLNSAKPFELLGSQDGTGGWMDGAGTSTEGGGWNTGGPSAERSSWSSFPASDFSLQPGSSSANPDLNKEAGASAWETKTTPSQNSSWGTAATVGEEKANTEQVGGWGKASTSTGFGASSGSSWGAAKVSTGDQAVAEGNWGSAKSKQESAADTSNNDSGSWGNNKNATNNLDGGWKKSEDSWDKGKSVPGATSSWGNVEAKKTPADTWGKAGEGSSQTTWGKAAESLNADSAKGPEVDSWGKLAEKPGNKAGWNNSSATPESKTVAWGNPGGSSQANAKGPEEDSWGKLAEGSSLKNGSSESKSAWNSSSTATPVRQTETASWGKADGILGSQPNAEASGWKKGASASGDQTDNWGSTKKDGENTKGWSKGGSENLGEDSWSKPKTFGADGGSSWSKQDGGTSWNKQGGGSSWNKQDGGSSWSKPSGGDEDGTDQQRNWGSSDGGRGGRGFGGRRGRGGRDNFGRGRSFDRDQSTDSAGGGRGGGWGNSGWKKDEDGATNQSGSWGTKKTEGASGGDGGSTWGSQGGGSSWGNQGGGSSWANKEGGSSWSKENDSNNDQGFGGGGFDGGRGSGGRRGGRGERGRGGRGGRDNFGRGRSFDQEQSGSWSSGGQSGGGWGNKKAFDSSDKEGGSGGGAGSTWGSQGGGGGSSWGNQGGGSSWANKEGGSTWSKQNDSSNDQGGGSSWGNQGGGSSWANKEGGSSWSKQNDSGNDQGFGGGGFDGGRGSGGRRGGRGERGRGGRGGRDNFGRGRSFDREQSGSWGSGGQSGAGWGNNKAFDSGDKEGGSGGGGGSTWGTQGGGGGSSWGSQGGGSSWNNKGNGSSSAGGWGNNSTPEGGKKDDTGGSGWGSSKAGGWGNNSAADGSKKDEAGGSGWGNSKPGGWGNNSAVAGGKKDEAGGSGWGNPKPGGGWGSNSAPGSDKKDEAGGSGWGNKKSGGWGNNSAADGGKKEDAGGSGWGNSKAGGGWGNTTNAADGGKKDEGGSSSGWGNQKKDGQDGGAGGGWGKNGGGDKKDDAGSSGGWGNQKKDGQDGGAGGGWGKSSGGW